MKRFGGLNLLYVIISKRTDVVMKNKLFFNRNFGISVYYCDKGIIHPIILNTTSLITVKLCC